MSKMVAIVIGVLTCGSAYAKTLSFPQVWEQVSSLSSAQMAAKIGVQAAESQRDRASRHWVPRLYLDARGYQTNDPAASFMGILEQRKLEASDFSPDALNHPNSRFFSRGALGLELPLYEGGARLAQQEMLELEAKAQKQQSEQVTIDQYAFVGNAFGSIGALHRWQGEIQKLQESMQGLLKSYRLGSKSNPLGYSGLLGMQSLRKRLIALQRAFEAQKRSQRAALQELGISAGEWSPDFSSAQDFVSHYFSRQPDFRGSFRTEASWLRVLAGSEAIKVERSKFLPSLGLFGESYAFRGSRATDTGYSAGVYLHWNLFSPMEIGSVLEARFKALAAEQAAEASAQQERAEKAGLQESVAALEENIQTLRESEEILQEQAKVAENLFRNGSINVLQFLEVLNRRTDLIVQQAEADLSLLKAATQAATKESFEIVGSEKEKKAESSL